VAKISEKCIGCHGYFQDNRLPPTWLVMDGGPEPLYGSQGHLSVGKLPQEELKPSEWDPSLLIPLLNCTKRYTCVSNWIRNNKPHLPCLSHPRHAIGLVTGSFSIRSSYFPAMSLYYWRIFCACQKRLHLVLWVMKIKILFVHGWRLEEPDERFFKECVHS
jgi:hypothetical protein